MSENSAKLFDEKIRENIQEFYFFLNMNNSKGHIAVVVKHAMSHYAIWEESVSILQKS